MNNIKRLITLSGTLAVCAFTTAACSTLPEPGEYAVITARNGQIVQTYTIVVADAGQTQTEED